MIGLESAITKVPNFELLPIPKPRVKAVYFVNNMTDKLKKELSFYQKLSENQ